MIRNPSANTGNVGSMPDPGRSHMPYSHLSLCATAVELVVWSLGIATTEPMCLEPVL